jgi:hypothetical protein
MKILPRPDFRNMLGVVVSREIEHCMNGVVEEDSKGA